MLKRISVSDAELGMFIQKLEGSWFKHPFWKSRFLLTDPEMLADLRDSDIDAVIIDISRGKDVAPAPQPALAEAGAGQASAATRVGLRAVHARPSAGLAAPRRAAAIDRPPAFSADQVREFGKASKVANAAQKVVSRVFLQARLGKTIEPAEVEPVVDEIFQSVQKNAFLFSGLMRCRSDTEYVYRHSLAVSALMISFARSLGFSAEATRAAGLAGLLMDIGVNQYPVEELAEGGDYCTLEPADRVRHVQYGVDMLTAAEGVPEAVLNVCRRHHERIDGRGYPDGLHGDEIDRLSRMAAICDTFDNLCEDGSGEGFDPARAIEEMMLDKGAFDTDLLRAFVETVGVYPVGSFVRLESERLAMVIGQDPSDYTVPIVRTFYSMRSGSRLKGENIALGNCYGEDRILGHANLAGLDLPEPRYLRERILLAGWRPGR